MGSVRCTRWCSTTPRPVWSVAAAGWWSSRRRSGLADAGRSSPRASMSDRARTRTDGPDVDGLLLALRRLDRRLRSAVAAMRAADPEAEGDPYRGLYVTRADVDYLLGRPPGVPTLSP